MHINETIIMEDLCKLYNYKNTSYLYIKVAFGYK